LQFAALPVSWSVVHAFPSSQLVGHESGGSHVSLASTVPLPQLAEQSVSVVASQAVGQQPSPATQVSMELWLQEMSQVAELPVI
jgi:hypothetical protein